MREINNDCFVTAYEYYISDIYNIPIISLEDKNLLIEEIIQIIKKLNNLFCKVGNITRLDDERKKPWISDKVYYCINKCSDKELLNEIKNLYNEYVFKRNILVESNLKFVIMVVYSFYKSDSSLSFDDLLQYGNIGLIRALETYDPNYGTEFITYANYWIRQSIINNSKKMMYSYKIPVYLFDLNNKRWLAIEELTVKLGRIPTDSEIASYMGITLDKFNIITAVFENSLSLDEPSGIHLDGLDVLRIELVSDDSVNVEEEVIENRLLEELNTWMIDVLSDREIFVLKSKYGLGMDEMKTVEIAKILGVSSQRVDQIKQIAFNKLLRKNNFKKMKTYLR